MYPQTNAVRSVRDLSGVWDFRFNANEPWQPIAVPASYNDQSPDPEFRRHYGMAYYRTTFTVPEGARRVLRFDAVTHNAVVRLNGQEIVTHRGGFLPFEADITALAKPGDTVTLEVEVDNRIGHGTLPVGNEGGTAFFGSDNAGIPAVEAGKARQQMQGVNLPNFDFFNYAGITRPVRLYTTPAAYIRDITLMAGADGKLHYTVDTVGEGNVQLTVLWTPTAALLPMRTVLRVRCRSKTPACGSPAPARPTCTQRWCGSAPMNTASRSASAVSRCAGISS